MLTWPDGEFELWQSQAGEDVELADGGATPDQVGVSTTFLLIEAARRADEAAGIRGDRAATPANDQFEQAW